MSELPSEIKVPNEDQTETSSPKKQPLGVRTTYRFLLTIAWSMVVLLVADTLYFYTRGMANRGTFSFSIVGLYLIFIFVASPALVISVILFLKMLICKELKKKQAIFGLGTVICVGLAVFFYLKNPCPDIYLKGFEKWVDEHVDVEKIREWMISAGEKYWEESRFHDNSYYRNKSLEEFPDFLKNFKVQYLFLERSKLDNSRIVRYEWGGTVDHRAVVIGSVDMQMPKQEIEVYSENDVELRRMLEPGVYIYSRQ